MNIDKEKLIKWLETTCGELDGLASSSDDDDSKYYTGQLVFGMKILEHLKNGYFDR